MKGQIRSVFISDSHLGMQLARGRELADFLASVEPEYLYIVGDFVDAWALRTRWHWPPVYNQIIDRVLELSRDGTQVRYTPGNHDAFLRGTFPNPSAIQFADSFVHETADGLKLVVTHGDRLDSIERNWKWLSYLGTCFYALVIRVNLVVNWVLRRCGLPPWFFCFWIKRTSKKVLGAYGRFNARLIEHAKELDADGIVCGHVHRPQLAWVDSTLYVNTGDWLENASCLLEENDGTLVLINHGCEIGRRPATERPSDRHIPSAPSNLENFNG